MNLAEAATAACVAGGNIASLLVLGWALVGDPARGRRRCPRCAYDMSGVLPGPASPEGSGAIYTCPECGRRCRGEKDLLRTRRRWRIAAIALLVEVGCLYFWLQRMPGREGWRGLIPSVVLIELVDDPESGSELAKALMRRQADGQLTRTQNRRIVERQIDRWIAAGGPARLIQYRPVWPVGEPMIVSMWAATGIPSPDADVWYTIGPAELVTSPGGLYAPRPGSHVDFGRSGPPRRDATLTPVAEGTNHFPVVLQIRAISNWSDTPDWTIERAVPVPITVVGRGTIDDLLPPVADPGVEAALASALSFHIGIYEMDARERLWLIGSMDSAALAHRAFPGAIAYDIILERAGAPVLTIPMWYTYPEDGPFWAGIPILPIDDPRAAGLFTVEPLRFAAPDAVIRFRSRFSPTALARTTITSRWVGDFAVPLADFPITHRWDPETRGWVQGEAPVKPAGPAGAP